ncbi:MAG: hypothetical protein MI725_11125 [Pirellulales bacterium]|nr:hypothetical protein [Pirellulales bacterium]
MKKLVARRRRNLMLLFVLALVLLVANAIGSAALYRTAVASGWLLLTLVVVLALYNVRKKLPFLPLGNSATWLQIHIYVGLLSGVLFAIHLQWRLPNGVFERLFALLYLAVFLSGVFGLIISRVFARRLSERPGEFLFRRISPLRHHLLTRVERLLIQCMETTESTGVSEFYAKRLKSYFEGPRHFWQHLLLSGRPVKRLLSELQAQERYLNETERDAIRQVGEYVRLKDDLDYHYAHQVTLRYWLFAHVPLTYALLAFAFIHVVLVYAFSGVLQ